MCSAWLSIHSPQYSSRRRSRIRRRRRRRRSAFSIAWTGAHLVGHRADAADARGDVRRLAVVAPAEQGLEEARRLEDAAARRSAPAVAVDRDVQRALALDARQVVDLDGARLIWPWRSLSVAERRRVGVEGAVDARRASRSVRRAGRSRRSARRCWASPWARSSRSSRDRRPGRARRSRPASPVPGTACRGRPCTQTLPRACTPSHTLGCASVRPPPGQEARPAPRAAGACSIGQPRSSKSTLTWSAIGVEVASVSM